MPANMTGVDNNWCNFKRYSVELKPDALVWAMISGNRQNGVDWAVEVFLNAFLGSRFDGQCRQVIIVGRIASIGFVGIVQLPVAIQ